MSWVKIDDGAPLHPKVLQAGAEAAWFWVCGMAWANKQKASDGFVPKEALPILFPVANPKRLAARLVAVGLWEEVDGGYQIHDYNEYQPDAVKKAELARKRADAGSKGGSKRQANAKQVASTEIKQVASTTFKQNSTPTRPVPDPVIDDPPKAPPEGSGSRVALRGDWRPENGDRANLVLAGVPDWAVEELATTYAAGMAAKREERSPTEWASSFTWWATREWRERGSRMKKSDTGRKTEEQELAETF